MSEDKTYAESGEPEPSPSDDELTADEDTGPKDEQDFTLDLTAQAFDGDGEA